MAVFGNVRPVEMAEIPSQTLLGTVVIGAVVGIGTWLLSLLVQSAVVEPIFCRSIDSLSACANGGSIAIITALIVMNIIGLFALVRLNVYRPLLVVLAALVTLWGVHQWVGGMHWLEASLWYGLVFALAYTLYAWIARLLSFRMSLLLIVVVTIVFRLIVSNL